MDGLQFTGSDGSPVELKSLFVNKPVIVSLVFYKCPDICGLVLNGMLNGFKDIDFVPGKDFDVVTLSIDPRETSELANLKRETVLNDLKKVKPTADWKFLTGEEPGIRRLSEKLGFGYKRNTTTGLYSHAPGIFVLDSKGNLSASLADVMYPKDVLEYSLIRASDGNLGSWPQKIRAFWLEYDFEKNNLKPSTAKIALSAFIFFLFLFVFFKFTSHSRVKNEQH